MTELEIYPSPWEDNTEEVDYLTGHFKTIKELYAEASKNGEAIITFIN